MLPRDAETRPEARLLERNAYGQQPTSPLFHGAAPFSTQSGTEPRVRTATNSVGFRFSRNGQRLTVSFSRKLPPPVNGVIRGILLNASIWSQLTINKLKSSGSWGARRRIHRIRASEPRVFDVRQRAVNRPATFSITGIDAGLDRTLARVIETVLGAWASSSASAQSQPVEYIVFDDGDVITGSGSEPGLVSQDWIISLIASIPGLVGEAAKELGTLFWEITVDSLIDDLSETDTGETTPVPMGTPSDAGAPGEGTTGDGGDATDGGTGDGGASDGSAGEGEDAGTGAGSDLLHLAEDMDPDPYSF